MAKGVVFASLVCVALGSSLPPWTLSAGLGFIEGFLSKNNADTDQCIAGLLSPIGDIKDGVADIKQGFKDKNLTDIEEGFKELTEVMPALQAAMQQCQAAEKDIKAIGDVLKDIHSLKDVIAHIKADFNDDATGEIAAELELTLKSFEQKQYDAFGRHAGTLMHRLFIGRYPDNTVLV
jgi:hypothetical protein